MGTNVVLNKEIFKINPKEVCDEIESFIREYFKQSNKRGIVVPISGGLDSSVVIALCVRAIGKEKVIGLFLPEFLGNPEANTYGELIAKHLDVQTKRINISPILRNLGSFNPIISLISGREFFKPFVSQYLSKKNQDAMTLYDQTFKGNLDSNSQKLISQVNSKQRTRLLITYKYAVDNNLCVVGSSHKTEQMVGLFVKYGIDDCADIMPLRNMYRSHIVQIAEYMQIPQDIINRTPNPDILPE